MLQDVDRTIKLHVLFLFCLGALGPGSFIALVWPGGRSRTLLRRGILVALLLPVLEMMRQISLMDLRVLVELAKLGRRLGLFA